MYYEVYADSLFVLYFVLDLYVLLLVNQLILGNVKVVKILIGAGLGAVLSILPLFVSLPWMKGGIWYACSWLFLGIYTFRIRNRKQFFYIMKTLLLVMVVLGGVITLLMNLLPRKGRFLGIAGVLLLGALCGKWLSGSIRKKREQGHFCKVWLVKKEGKLEVKALIDTGNALMEPISGKPVAVIGEALLKKYYGEEIPQVYRVIPFHSVGKRNGMLRGYQLEEMIIETEAGEKLCKDVFVAVSEELLTEGKAYEMILNPKQLL